jgi:acyl-CoA thioester hydrolase
MPVPFRYYLRVRYGECDAQRVVFNARFAEYVDVASMELFRALGYGPQVMSGEFDFQVVKQTIEWRAPARLDDVVEIAVQAERLGTTSFTLSAEFRRAGAELLARAETVYVVVDTHTLQKKPIPDDVRAALNAGTSTVTDHAAYLGPGNTLPPSKAPLSQPKEARSNGSG